MVGGSSPAAARYKLPSWMEDSSSQPDEPKRPPSNDGLPARKYLVNISLGILCQRQPVLGTNAD